MAYPQAQVLEVVLVLEEREGVEEKRKFVFRRDDIPNITFAGQTLRPDTLAPWE
jgi:hypothetical protein